MTRATKEAGGVPAHRFTLPPAQARERAREKARAALQWLARYGVSTPGLLAAAQGLDPTAGYAIVRRLEREGSAELRKSSEGIGARTLVIITPHGSAVAAHELGQPAPQEPMRFEPGVGRGSVPHALNLQLCEILVLRAGGMWEAMRREDWRAQGFASRADALVTANGTRSIVFCETQIQAANIYAGVIQDAQEDIQAGRADQIMFLANGYADALREVIRTATQEAEFEYRTRVLNIAGLAGEQA